MGRSQKKVIFIYCEGWTEFNYFEGYRKDTNIERNAELNIFRPTGDSSLALFKHADKHSKRIGKKSIDEVYCIMDLDNNSKNKLEEIESFAKKHKINIIFSNPCFEIWILFHFKNILAFMTQDLLEKEIKHLIPNYDKNDPEIYEKLRSKIKIAISNSEKIYNQHSKNNIKFFSINSNPHSDCAQFLSNFSTRIK